MYATDGKFRPASFRLRDLGQGRGLERRALECLCIQTKHFNWLRVSPTLTLFWVLKWYHKAPENETTPSIRQTVCLYFKLLKRGCTLYVTDDRQSLQTAKLRFLGQGRELEGRFISQTRELAPRSTFRFQFWLFETKEYGAKPSRQQTGVSCLQLEASTTLVKVEDSNARSLNFGFWLYMNKTTGPVSGTSQF